jgi:hypothetical protein
LVPNYFSYSFCTFTYNWQIGFKIYIPRKEGLTSVLKKAFTVSDCSLNLKTTNYHLTPQFDDFLLKKGWAALENIRFMKNIFYQIHYLNKV